MAATFFILKLAPPEIRALPPHDRLAFQSVVVEFALRRKDWELARGLNAKGEPLPPVSAETRKYRRSEMTPSGKGDPSAPYLMPGRRLSRTRSLLTGKAHADYAEFGWRFDPYTADQWGKILAIHARRGTDYDVVGLSVKGKAWVKAKALAAFRAWKAGEAPLPLPAAPRSAVAADVPVDVVGRTNLDHAVGGIGDGSVGESKRAIAEGRSTGFLTIDEWKKRWRSKAPAVAPGPGVPHSIRKGASNVLLRRVWPGSGPGQPPPAAPGGPAPGASPNPARIAKAAMRPAAKPKPKPKQTRTTADAIRIRDDVPADVADRFRHALGMIDRVHSCDGLPEVPMGADEAYLRSLRASGVFESGSESNQKIECSGERKTASSIAHEFGHFVDWNLLSGPDDVNEAGARWGHPALSADAFVRDWWDAVGDSPSVVAIRKTLGATTDDDPDALGKRNYLNYLLQPREIWARAYAQWIAWRCGDDAYRETSLGELYWDAYGLIPNLWDDDEFEPLADAMDRIFAGRGMLKFKPKPAGRKR